MKKFTKRDEADLRWLREVLRAAKDSPFNMSSSIEMFSDMINAIEQRKASQKQ
jgi:hypothetical protein